MVDTAKNEFTREFLKLLCNSSYGKTLEKIALNPLDSKRIILRFPPKHLDRQFNFSFPREMKTKHFNFDSSKRALFFHI